MRAVRRQCATTGDDDDGRRSGPPNPPAKRPRTAAPPRPLRGNGGHLLEVGISRPQGLYTRVAPRRRSTRTSLNARATGRCSPSRLSSIEESCPAPKLWAGEAPPTTWSRESSEASSPGLITSITKHLISPGASPSPRRRLLLSSGTRGARRRRAWRRGAPPTRSAGRRRRRSRAPRTTRTGRRRCSSSSCP